MSNHGINPSFEGDAFGFEGLAEKLALAKSLVEKSIMERSPEKNEEILRKRAGRLAKESAGALEPQGREFLHFHHKGKAILLESRFIRQIIRPREIVPIPGAPSFIKGIFHYRGIIFSALDLYRFIGAEFSEGSDSAEEMESGMALLLQGAGNEWSLVVKEINGLVRLEDERIEAYAPSSDSPSYHHAQGFSPEGWLLLDGNSLNGDTRITGNNRQK